jgi:F-type H+-transporting ATPase subunit b
MEDTLRQLGGLLLGAIPTVILFVATYVSYRVIVHKPLVKVLEERYSRSEGAMEEARADIAAAEGKTAEYEQRLREAKVAIFKAQEVRRQQALQARANVVAEARQRAGAQVTEARQRLDQELQAAKAQLQPESERLAAAVIRTILKPVSGAQSSAGGGR